MSTAETNSDRPDATAESVALAASLEAVRALPADFVKRHRVLPIKISEGTLHIATPTPGNQRVIDDIRLLTGLEVEESLAPEAEIAEKIARHYQVTVEKMIENLSPGNGANGEAKNLHDIEVMANEPTVVNLVNVIISTAIRERASDIHFVPFENFLQLRYRVDGLLQEKPPPPKNLHAALVSRIKIMADMNIAERYMPQDGHIQIHHRGSRVDIRVGTMPTIYGESLVMRLLEKSAKVPTAVELGLDPERSALLSRLVEKPHGLFLTTGPTGSGKTTTLYSLLQSIYTPELKIITIEDPVEYELPGIAQIPVRASRNFTFATGLRAILRQDPDVVMVGEIRDNETAEIAVQAALTGHLVLSTVHTNDAVGAVTRLRDMGIEPFLLASCLRAVIAQRLVRRLCAACSELVPVGSDGLERAAAADLGIAPGAPIHQPKGCSACGGTGFDGRIGVFEALRIDDTVRRQIHDSADEALIAAHAFGSGAPDLTAAARALVLAGRTSASEALRNFRLAETAL